MSALTPTQPAIVGAPPALPPAPTTTSAIVIDDHVRLPANITDLASFRQWALNNPWPDHTRFAYLAGVLWVSLSMEQAYTHNDVKSEFTNVLRGLARASGLGRYFGDGMVVSNPAADLSTVPDGLYILHATFQANRVLEVAGRRPGVIEFEGTPDMALEVVSDNSEDKDFRTLPILYHRAGIAEFWRADARGDLRFEIFRWAQGGYVSTQLPDGWWHSDLFGRDFQLTAQQDVRGRPEFILHSRP
jgi:Uma2 family endonuclease